MAEGGGALRELLVSFGIEVEGAEKLKEVNEHVKEGLGRVVEFGKALVAWEAAKKIKEYFEGTVDAVKEFLLGQAEMGAELEHTAERLGISTDSLQQFQYAAKLAGVSEEAAAHSLILFNRQVGEAIRGGGDGAEAFKKLGVRLKDAHGEVRPLDDMLGDLAEGLQKLPSHQEKAAVAMQLFGRQGSQMLPILLRGREGLADLRKEFKEFGGGLSGEFVQQSVKAEEEQAKLSLGWKSIKSTIALTVLPILNSLLERFSKYMKVVVNVVKNTNLLKDAWTIAKPVLLALGTTLAIVLSPLLLFSAFVLALFLLIQDFMVFLRGGKSVIGDWVAEWEGVEGKDRLIKQINDAIDLLEQALKDVSHAVGELEGALASLSGGDSKSAVQWLIDSFVVFLHVVSEVVNHVATLLKLTNDVAHGNFAAALGDIGNIQLGKEKLRDAVTSAPGISSDMGQMLSVALQQVPQMMPQPFYQAGPGVGQGQGPGPWAPQITQHNRVEVNVETNGGQDSPDKVGHAIGQGVTDKLQAEMQNSLNAVRKK